MPTPFLGMRGTGDWASNEVPESWDEYILKEFPNGMAPLTAMLSKLPKETVDSTKHHWWTETLPTQSGSVSSIYIDSGLGTEYVYASHASTHGIADAVVYAKVAENLAKEFKDGHTVVLRDSDQLDVDVTGHVVDVVLNGSSSYIAVKLMEADDNHASASTYNLATVDYIMVSGSGYAEGSAAPEPLTYLPSEFYNLTQIHRNTFEITGSAKATKLRTGPAYLTDKKRCAELHSIEHEKMLFWGLRRETIGRNNKKLRFADGLRNFIKRNVPANISDFETTTDSAYSGKTWLQAGKKWLDTNLATLFRYAVDEVIGYCGDLALLGIQELAEAYGNIQLKVAEQAYGILVTEWLTPFGRLYLKTHPLFSHEPTHRNFIFLLKPQNIKIAPLVGGGENRDTHFEENMQLPGVDGTLDGFLTEATVKFYFPNQFMWLRGVGKDNIN